MSSFRARGGPVGAFLGSALVLAACAAPATTVQPSDAQQRSVTPTAPASDPPPACLDAKLVWADALGQLLLTNCLDQSDLDSVEMLWTWDGTAWEELSDDGPPGHVVTSFAWDADRDVLVRYGGIPLPTQECSPETWEWDMTTWHRIEADPPEPCDHVELAAVASGGLLLVGGGRAQALAEGTWGWEGITWNQLADDGPAPRAHHGLVADGHRAVLYGGLDNSHVFDDLWTWDGSAWDEQAVDGAGPGPRSHHGLAAGATGVLLFGGATSTSTFVSLVDETWLLADGAWSRLEGPGPSARGLPALGYDPDREVVVLHGGFDADGTALADTWEWDGAWSCVAGC